VGDLDTWQGNAEVGGWGTELGREEDWNMGRS